MTVKGIGARSIDAHSDAGRTEVNGGARTPSSFASRLEASEELSPTERIAEKVARRIEGGELSAEEGASLLVESLVEAQTKHLPESERSAIREMLVDDPTIQLAASAMLLEATAR